MIHVSAMNADLVGPSGVELEAQQGVVAETFHQSPVGAGVTTVFAAHHRVFLAIRRMTTNGSDDRAGIATGHAMDDGEVLPDAIRFWICTCSRTRASWLLAITMQPVVSLSRRCTIPGRNLPLMPGSGSDAQAVHRAVLVARRWMHRQPGRLVEHDQMVVLKKHIQIHRLRLEIRQWFRWRHPQLHLVALPEGGFALPVLPLTRTSPRR